MEGKRHELGNKRFFYDCCDMEGLGKFPTWYNRFSFGVDRGHYPLEHRL